MKDRQKKQNVLRLVIQCLSFAFHNGYASGWAKGKIYSGSNKAFCVPGLNCYSCPGAIGACPIGSLQAVLDDSGFHLSLYVVGFIGMVGIFCGRFVCGWLCPFGLVQDLLYRIPFFKKIKNLPGHKYLCYLRFVILAVFVIALPMGVKNQADIGQPWFCEYICPSGTLLGGIPLVIANKNLQEIIGVRFIWKVVLLVLILVAAVLSDRPFCKYICPLGAMYGLANPISIYRFKIDKATCVKCGACQRICGADIKVYENPNSIDCIRCGKCMAACPTGSIYSTFSSRNSVVPPISKSDTEKQKSAVFIILGALCLIIPAYVMYKVLSLLYIGSFNGMVENVKEFVRYLFDSLAYLVPAVMTLILGFNLFRIGIHTNAITDQSDTGKLRQWAMNTLAVTGASVVLTYIVYMILSIFDFGRVSVVTLIYPKDLMSTSINLAVMLAAVNLVTWLAIPGKKNKNT